MGQPTNGTHKVRQIFNQREVTQKVRKAEGSFLHATPHLDLIHIAIKLIIIKLPSYGMHKDSVKKNHQKEVIQKLRKGEQSFL